MGWFKERAKAIEHGVKKGIDSATYNIFGKGIITGREKDNYGIYVGYNSNDGLSISTPYYGPNAHKLWPEGTPGYTPEHTPEHKYNYGTVTKNNTQGYSRTTAATAKDIAQGGMTKDEVIEFNIKHPNEVAGYNPGYETSLNTNTARSK